MTGRVLIALTLAAAPVPGFAEVAPLDADVRSLTWRATHIVVVEDGSVVESWEGDLKPGAELPDGAAGFARIKPPAFDRHWLDRSGEAPPAVSGKRRVLFLAHVPRYGGADRDPEW